MHECVRTRVSTIYTAIHTTCASHRKFARARCARDVDDAPGQQAENQSKSKKKKAQRARNETFKGNIAVV